MTELFAYQNETGMQEMKKSLQLPPYARKNLVLKTGRGLIIAIEQSVFIIIILICF
jgi:hypothetical protein